MNGLIIILTHISKNMESRDPYKDKTNDKFIMSIIYLEVELEHI